MIELQNISKSYGGVKIFDNLSFTFDDTGLICLLGASGCGKTTLLNILAGFDRDYSGQISVLGESISKMNEDQLCYYRRDCIGFVFQNYHLLSGYTVLENVLLPSELNGESEELNRKNAEDLLNKLGLSAKLSEKVENLSGGQKQRVAIARALINNPSIILADEPTGALDRKNSAEIMNLLKEISKDRLVIVITHDKKNCDIADRMISIVDGALIAEDRKTDIPKNKQLYVKEKNVKISVITRGFKNFKVHFLRNMAVALAISLGVLCFVLSLSSGNVLGNSIDAFKQKNIAFNNGYIQLGDQTDPIELLKKDTRIENVYYQYKIDNVELSLNGKTERINEKSPTPKSTQAMAYGSIPKTGENQIALSPSLAQKFEGDLSKLIGQKINLLYGGQPYVVTISGIFNGTFDDFIISSDVEKDFYKDKQGEKPYSISYDVKDFEDIVAVSEKLEDNKIQSKNAAKEVANLQNTFHNISRLFLVVSMLILGISLFISTVLLVKLQSSRYSELGLLSALGFGKSTISKMIISENLILSFSSILFYFILAGIIAIMNRIFSFGFISSSLQLVISALGTGIIVVCISFLASYKLIRTEPAVALRK